ncbi:choice-of-anchor H family protein [Salinimonas marina]|uniref:Choice-of-anchor H family protein n=1 Tax=Salinimonas marina TaxID=2785918 RepID=A0A7S9DY95_9ALTE|nr:choice-of-anchor H family protein [Salinimonas marina]QPG06189.1 choice-of-anchor H family protein [Salinimonas marina]
MWKNTLRLTTFVLLGLGLSLPTWANSKVTVKETQFEQPLKESSLQQQKDKRSVTAFASRPKSRVSHHDEPDFWIFDSWSELYQDNDFDNYYSSLRLSVDVDSVYSQAPVYLVVYLGDATEYSSVHVSSVFDVYGDDSNDFLTMDIELVTGFAPFDYDVLVEVYDAQTDELVAFSDAQDDADLSLLSLESADYDRSQGETVVVVEEHGGSLAGAGLAALLAVGFYRRVYLSVGRRA